MDMLTIGGIVLGLGGILLGQVLEGGHISSIMQFTAGIIVIGGTLGAVVVGATAKDLKTSIELLKMAFFNANSDPVQIAKEIIVSAQLARRESILVLEKSIGTYTHPFMNTVFRYVVDGYDSNAIRELAETQITLEEEHLMGGAKLYTDAGGFAPTIGIIGAVLGLIHVMENLSDTSKLGGGIAVAFVATVYGVGSANLLFLPLANKLKRKIKLNSMAKEMILLGALGIVEGHNPHVIQEGLSAYISGDKDKLSVEGEGEQAKAA